MADPYDPGTLAGRARRRRWDSLIQLFPNLQEMSVVDLGGDTRHWAAAPVRPRRLVLLNTRGYALDEAAGEGAELVYGDACDPPDSLTDQRFDLVYSNSVIEHVGGAWRRRAFAASVHRLGQGHWIQTPYRYFPLEPHWLVPGFQFLPLATRAAFDRIWPLRPSGPRSRDEAHGPAPVESTLDVELLTKTEMRYLFPSSELIAERFAGLTKSLIAVRTLDIEPAKE